MYFQRNAWDHYYKTEFKASVVKLRLDFDAWFVFVPTTLHFLSVWSYPNATYIADPNMYWFELASKSSCKLSYDKISFLELVPRCHSWNLVFHHLLKMSDESS